VEHVCAAHDGAHRAARAAGEGREGLCTGKRGGRHGHGHGHARGRHDVHHPAVTLGPSVTDSGTGTMRRMYRTGGTWRVLWPRDA